MAGTSEEIDTAPYGRAGARRGDGAWGAVVLGTVLALMAAGAVHADTIRVKGDTLRGRVADLTSDGVTFEPVHGSGAIVVPFDDVEDLRTDARLAVMYGDRGEAHGRVLGLEDGVLLVGEDPADAQRVPVATLFHARPDDEFGDSIYGRLQSRFRHWTASLDAGFGFTDSTSDNSSAFTAIRLERNQGRTHLLFDGNFRYATEKESGEPRTVTENIVTGLLRGEYDVSERWFTFASTRGTYDEDKNLSLRLEPRGGAGARIVKRDHVTLNADLGAAWIYEDFFGSEPIFEGSPLVAARGSDNFWAVAFGSDLMWKLPLGVVWRASGDYLPAVDDWTNDYLLRGDTSLEIPLIEWISFKIRALDEYDNTPAEGNDRNRFTLTGLLSVTF